MQPLPPPPPWSRFIAQAKALSVKRCWLTLVQATLCTHWCVPQSFPSGNGLWAHSIPPDKKMVYGLTPVLSTGPKEDNVYPLFYVN